MLKWYEQKAPDGDVVISSRVRLARNLTNYPFSLKISNDQAKKMVEEVKEITEDLSHGTGKKHYSCNLSTLANIDKRAMVERHIISPHLVEKQQVTGLILSEDETISIMINEEDHLRIQSIVGGMNLEAAYEVASRVDDIASEKFDIAFDKKYGYLASCPTNVGTGLRASCMVFLPALSSAGIINRMFEELSKYGVTIRGIYGEGSKSLGSLYQISNQKTLGNTEQEIIYSLNNVVNQIVRQERLKRQEIKDNNYDKMEDQVYRAYGVLKYARQLTSSEAISLLAQIKLAIDCGLIKFDKDVNIHKLMMGVQPGSLQWTIGKDVDDSQEKHYRAEYLRKKIPKVI